MAVESQADHRNEVTLRGEVAEPPEERELPSGDTVVSVRLRVRTRVPAGSGAGGRRADDAGTAHRTEALTCTAWSAGVRRFLLALGTGDVVEISGVLHRRFWRAPTGPVSVYEVVAARARRVRRAQASA